MVTRDPLNMGLVEAYRAKCNVTKGIFIIHFIELYLIVVD
jgi:hypothetical protein